MRLAPRHIPVWPAAGLQFICLGWIILWLLAGVASGQAGWPPGEIKISAPGETVLRRVIFFQPDRRPGNLREPAVQETIPADWEQKPDNIELSRRRLAKTAAQNSASPPSGASGQPANPQCPLPPASAFSLQANLLKYLDTWPTPGATVAPAEEVGGREFDEDDLH